MTATSKGTAMITRPQLPQSYLRRMAEGNRPLRQASAIMADARRPGASVVDLMRAIDAIDFNTAMRPETAEERADREAYNAAAAAYNREVQARRNDREVAKVRAARCPSCFTVPSASGACNC